MTGATDAAARYSGTRLDHSVASIWRVAAASPGGTFGIFAGLLIGLSRVIERVLGPTMYLLRSSTAWVPLSLVFFGIGAAPAIFLIGLVVSAAFVVSAMSLVYLRFQKDCGTTAKRR